MVSLPTGNEAPSAFNKGRDLYKMPANPPRIYTSSRTASLDDVGHIVFMNSASSNSYTIPPDGGEPFPDYSVLIVCQRGAGATTIVEGSGVTVNSLDDALVLSGQFAVATLLKTGANEWLAFGGLTAA